ncbi:hypothetical protein N7453_011781 [Penicillium expansum]|nr:hypothetical protein N7453_011781 [Penicillium expansum]
MLTRSCLTPETDRLVYRGSKKPKFTLELGALRGVNVQIPGRSGLYWYPRTFPLQPAFWPAILKCSQLTAHRLHFSIRPSTSILIPVDLVLPNLTNPPCIPMSFAKSINANGSPSHIQYGLPPSLFVLAPAVDAARGASRLDG